jgi:hypothetical protein
MAAFLGCLACATLMYSPFSLRRKTKTTAEENNTTAAQPYLRTSRIIPTTVADINPTDQVLLALKSTYSASSNFYSIHSAGRQRCGMAQLAPLIMVSGQRGFQPQNRSRRA